MSDKPEDKSQKSDPLQNLFVDGEEIDRGLLANLLKDYIRIDSKNFKPVFREKFYDLDAKTKLLLYLLYKKALLVTGKISPEEEPEKPKAISKITGVNHNSTRSYLSQLGAIGLVVIEGGGYLIPGYSLPKIAELRKKEDHE